MDFCPFRGPDAPFALRRSYHTAQPVLPVSSGPNFYLPGTLQLASQVHAIIPPHAEMDGCSELSFPRPSLLGPHPISIEPSKLFLFLPLISLGHCFGPIPASCSFVSSAFPVPPLPHWVPSDKAAARLGSSGLSLLGAPKKMGQEKGEQFRSYLYVKWNSFGLRFARRRFRH